MQIQVWFTNDKYIDIKLFDNSTVIKWFIYFKNLNKTYTGRYISLTTCGFYNSNTQQKYWDIILDTIAKLKSIGLVYPDVLPDKFNMSQQTLNELHRFFTTNDKWGIDYEEAVYASTPLPKNPIDSNFLMPDNMSFFDWHDIIEKINSAVHFLDRTTKTEGKLFINNNLPLPIYLIQQSEYDIDNWLPFNDDDQLLNYTYFDYDLPLVLLDRSIRGKCVLQSFYEDDDLNAQDCTGRLGSFGGFQFDLNSNRKKIYQSEMFTNWIAKHNRSFESIPFDFPIGYIKNFYDINLWLTPSSTLKKVEFVD